MKELKHLFDICNTHGTNTLLAHLFTTEAVIKHYLKNAFMFDFVHEIYEWFRATVDQREEYHHFSVLE